MTYHVMLSSALQDGVKMDYDYNFAESVTLEYEIREAIVPGSTYQGLSLDYNADFTEAQMKRAFPNITFRKLRVHMTQTGICMDGIDNEEEAKAFAKRVRKSAIVRNLKKSVFEQGLTIEVLTRFIP